MNKKNINRNKIVKARVTEKEKNIIKQKVKKYGYRNMSKYLIDAALHERVQYINIEGQDLIYKAFSEYASELKKIRKKVFFICEFATQLDEEKIESLRSLLFITIGNQKKMLNLINSKMDLKVWEEINRKKE